MQDNALAGRFEVKVGLELRATYDADRVAQINRVATRVPIPLGAPTTKRSSRPRIGTVLLWSMDVSWR